jgi:hypothetical protein
MRMEGSLSSFQRNTEVNPGGLNPNIDLFMNLRKFQRIKLGECNFQLRNKQGNIIARKEMNTGKN